LYVSNSSFEELLVVKLHVDLCLNLNKKSNKALSELLLLYLDKRDLNVNEIVLAASKVLQERWETTKLESAFSLHRKLKVSKRLNELLNTIE
jgi:hypothetical protein